MEMRLDGKVAVVTGGGTGIGFEITRAFCETGCKVIIASRDPEHLEGARKEFKGMGHDVETYVLDITRPDKVEAFAEHIDKNYDRFDLLVNNAGGNFICPVRRMSVNGWLSVININLNGSFYCSKFLGELMIKHGKGGAITNLVATYGWTGAPGNAHSASSKAGIMALTKSLATEWAQFGIRVNAVSPGPIETPIAIEHLKFTAPHVMKHLMRAIPMRRMGTTDEVARAVLFLSAPEWSSYVTGEILVVDGGACLFPGVDPTSYLEKKEK
jgi:NAD(P)-dependent dehydrogenase (short-subunit alcohol dehydrogenase family)